MTTPLDPVQLTLDLQLPDGTFVPVKVREDDIGAQLLPILSKGLYTDPLHCIREYVQNAVDAGATEIRIKITGNSVIIHDNGSGMTASQLVQARQFGVSLKDVRHNVGFRGIGIYSGFDLCNRLLITTKAADERKSYILEFDFGTMKRLIEDHTRIGTSAIPLGKILEDYSRFGQESSRSEDHYTVVQLEDISSFHIAQLSNRTSLRKYILRNLPIDFDSEFPYRHEINAAIARHLPGYQAVVVVLESDDQPTERVAKPAIPDLSAPIIGPIVNSKNEEIAFYWACLRQPADGNRGRIPDQYGDYRGFVYKLRGFTIGDNTKLQKYFKRGNSGLYLWYTGEIFVTDPAVLPNTERNDFERSQSQQVLEESVVSTLKILEKTAAEYQEQSRALDKFNDAEQWLRSTKSTINTGTFAALDLLLEADDRRSDLDDQKGRLEKTRRDWGQAILDALDELVQFLRDEVENPKPTAEKRRDAVKRRDEESGSDGSADSGVGAEGGRAVQTGTDAGAGTSETSDVAPQHDVTAAEKTEATPVRPLTALIQEAGWALGEDCVRLIDIIDRALGDVLASGSAQHRDVLADIEVKLTTELAD